MSFGWSDPSEDPIALVYRRKGERIEGRFVGPIMLMGEWQDDNCQLTRVPRTELPDPARLDLTRVPVIGIGGKRKWQMSRVREFLGKNLGFSGAFLLYPGSGNWDLGEGWLFVTSRGVLEGKKVSGGRPEVQLTNYRWLRDGRWVANKARMLHGKVLETIEAELEQNPGVEEVATALTGWSCPFTHRLHDELKAATDELSKLEGRRVLLSGEQGRDMAALVRECLVVKLTAAGVQRVAEIPADLTVTVVEIAPELVEEADILGTLEIPGLGRRLPKKEHADFDFGRQVPTVALTAEEFRRLEGWPFEQVFPVLSELGYARDQLSWSLRDVMRAPEAERLQKLRAYHQGLWAQRAQANRPKEVAVPNAHEQTPLPTPDPVTWGHDLLTGEPWVAYAALVHRVSRAKGRTTDLGWSFRWFDTAEDAARADTEARREAASYQQARQLEAALTAEATDTPLPIAPPAPYEPPNPTPAAIMERLGFTAEQFKVEGQGPWQRRIPGHGYHSEFQDRWVQLQSDRQVAEWHRRDGEVIVVAENATAADLLGRSRDYSWQAVAGQLTVAEETIQATRDWLEGQRQEAEAAHRAAVREWAQALRRLPAYAALAPAAQRHLGALVESSYGTTNIAKAEAELRPEWTKAEALHRRVQSGEVLTNFGGHFRRMGASGNVDYWVIPADGSFRDPDEVSYRKAYSSEGDKSWRLVGPAELALHWRPGHCEVVKRSAGAATIEQLTTVRRLERELGEPEGSFRLGAEYEDPARRQRLADEATGRLRALFATCPLCSAPMKVGPRREQYERVYEHQGCNNRNAHPADWRVNWDRSNSGLTEYDTVTLAVARPAGSHDVIARCILHKGGSVDVSWESRPDRREFEREDRLEEALLDSATHRQRSREEYAKHFQSAEDHVSGGVWMKLRFRLGRHPRTGAPQWEAGGKHVKYVLDQHSTREPVEGELHYVSLVKELVNTGTFKLIVVRLQPPYPEDRPDPDASEEVSEGEITEGDQAPEGAGLSIEDLQRKLNSR